MEYLKKLETTVLKWLKDVPHLPSSVRRQLGDALWWIILIVAIVGGIWALYTFFQLLGNVAILNNGRLGYLAPPAFVSAWTVTTGFIALGFSVISLLICAFAVSPLRRKIKEGWVLLFISWLVTAIGVVLGAVLSLNPLQFIIGLLFGSIFVVITGYLLFEVHSQFAHSAKKGVMTTDKTKSTK